MNNVCPVCGGTLIEYEEGVICDTCEYRIDNEGEEHKDGDKLLHDYKKQ